jgi:hypothetical protein
VLAMIKRDILTRTEKMLILIFNPLNKNNLSSLSLQNTLLFIYALIVVHLLLFSKKSQATKLQLYCSFINHGVWNPMPELTVTSPDVYFRVDSNTFTMGQPLPESTLTLCQSRRLYPPVKDIGFSLWV